MMQLIDADEMKSGIEFIIHDNKELLTSSVVRKAMLGLLGRIKTVDAMPIIRCRDCVYFDKHNGTSDWNGWCDKDEIYTIVRDDFYCGFAERKENADSKEHS